MIEVFEGLGGWTIKVKNGRHVKSFECASYVVKDKRGTPWFDFDRAMKEAEKYDNEMRRKGMSDARPSNT